MDQGSCLGHVPCDEEDICFVRAHAALDVRTWIAFWVWVRSCVKDELDKWYSLWSLIYKLYLHVPGFWKMPVSVCLLGLQDTTRDRTPELSNLHPSSTCISQHFPACCTCIHTVATPPRSHLAAVSWQWQRIWWRPWWSSWPINQMCLAIGSVCSVPLTWQPDSLSVYWLFIASCCDRESKEKDSVWTCIPCYEILFCLGFYPRSKLLRALPIFRGTWWHGLQSPFLPPNIEGLAEAVCIVPLKQLVGCWRWLNEISCPTSCSDPPNEAKSCQGSEWVGDESQKSYCWLLVCFSMFLTKRFSDTRRVSLQVAQRDVWIQQEARDGSGARRKADHLSDFKPCWSLIQCQTSLELYLILRQNRSPAGTTVIEVSGIPRTSAHCAQCSSGLHHWSCPNHPKNAQGPAHSHHSPGNTNTKDMGWSLVFGDSQGRSALYNAPGSSCDFTWQEDAEEVKPPKDEHLMHRSGGPSGRPRPASAPARRIAGRDDRKGLSACLVFCGCRVLDFMPRPFDEFWNVIQGFTWFQCKICSHQLWHIWA